MGAIILGVLVLPKLIKMSGRQESRPAIGILQTASHPALDLVRDSFIKSIRDHLGSGIDIKVQNAEGVLSQAHTIAKSFHADPDVRLIFTIATPATQVMATLEHEKPIVFAAVTDPKALGILDTHHNITGVRDMIDVPKEIDMMKKLLPDMRKVALLFNPSEINARQIVQQMKSELEKAGLSWMEVGMHHESEAAASVSMASRKADAILCPTDNTVAAAIQSIVNQSNKFNVPLIVSDNLLVLKGALAAQGVDYAISGQKASRLALEILDGKKPGDLPLQSPDTDQIFIHKERAHELGIEIPQGLPGKVELIDAQEDLNHGR